MDSGLETRHNGGLLILRLPRMLTIIAAWLYMSVLCFAFGWATVGALESSSGVVRAVPRSVLPLVGLAEIAVLTAYLSLLMPIGTGANLIVLATGIGLVWLRRDRIGPGIWPLARPGGVDLGYRMLCILVLLVFAIKSAIAVDGTLTEVFHSDTAYYHAPSIRWISEYGIVPGLGNLLSPLAVDYLWFQPAALFGFPFLLPHRLHALMGFTAFWAVCFALGGLRDWLGGSPGRTPSNLFRALTLLPLLELGNYIVSDSGDEPAAVFVLVAIALGCRFIEWRHREPGSRALFAAVLVLVLFTVGLKWSALPLAALAVSFTWNRARTTGWATAFAAAGIGGLMLAPKVIRSVILSGYLVYPFPALDWFDVDWKMPVDVVAAEKAYVESMARIRFDRPGQRLEGGFSDWFGDWVSRFVSTPVAWLLMASAALALLALVTRPNPMLAFARRYGEAVGAILLALGYWFVTAPHVRFAYGFLSAASLLLLTAAVVAWQIPQSDPGPQTLADGFRHTPGSGRNPGFGLVLGLVFASALLFSSPRPFPGDALGTGITFTSFYPNRIDRMRRGKVSRRAFVFQDAYPDIPIRLFRLGDLPIYRPVTGQHCWDAPLPCTPYIYRRIEKRGTALSAGFRAIPGPVEDFDGSRLAEEWRRQQAQQHTPESVPPQQEGP